MRPRQRREGDRRADQARRDQHQAARHGLHGDRADGAGLLQLRQRQRRHQGPPGQPRAGDRADRPGPGRGRREEADRDREGARHRRQHEHHRVRRQPPVLRGEGLQRDRLRHRAGVLRHAELLRRQHGPAAQRDRCRAVPDPPGRRQAGADPVQGARHGVHRGRLPRARQAGGRPDREPHGGSADPGRELGRAEGHAGGRPERRRRAQLHAAGGAQDPPGRGAAGSPGQGQGLGLLDALQHRLPVRGAGHDVRRQAGRQRRAEPGQHRRARTPTSTATSSRSTRRTSRSAASASSASSRRGSPRRRCSTWTATTTTWRPSTRRSRP